MSLSDNDIKKVASLAKLDLSPDEVSKYAEQLSQVLDYVRELDEIDTGSVEPTSQTTGLTNITRDDQVNAFETLTAEETLSGSDKTHNGYFVVPGLLDK